MLKYIVLTLALVVGYLTTVDAQLFKKKKTTENLSVNYKMTGQGQAAMLNGSTMKLIFKKDKSRTELNMMNGMFLLNVVMDGAKKNGLMTLQMMGQNKYAEMDETLMKEKELEQRNKKPTKVEYLKEYKEIAGYKCEKVKITVDGIGAPILMYITPKIKATAQTQLPIDINAIKGFPLEWSISMQGVTVVMQATDVSKELVDDALFNMTVPEGYEKMDIKDMKGLGGGFGL